MSDNSFPPRAIVALVTISLGAFLACTKQVPPDPVPRHLQYSDTAGANDGRSLEDMFATRFPGVTVTRAQGGGLHIRIRGGSNTFYGSNEPLFVIDDTPIESRTGGVVFLNPHDIEKIEVLKNPADIGVYGIRGGNGVIRITTKQARR